MSKLIKLVTGCDTFSMLTPNRPRGNCYSIDMEALVGDPTNQEVDQEITLILNHYGFTEIYGENGELLRRLKTGRARLTRQLVENEDYRQSLPQLLHAPEAARAEPSDPGPDTRPGKEDKAEYGQPSRPPTAFAPAGVSYEPTRDDPMGRPEVELKPRSGTVGATPTAHAPKARPSAAPEAKPMPSSAKRQPPDPPPSPRMQTEREGQATYTESSSAANEPGQSSQNPINPSQGEKGKGKKGDRQGSKGGHQGRGKGGWGRRHQSGWDYYRQW